MGNILLKQIDGGSVLPKDDAILYDLLCGQNGIIYGCNLSWQGSNQVHIDSGYGIIKGRVFEITEHTMKVNLPTSSQGTCYGYIIVRMNLENISSPIEIETMISSTKITSWTREEDANYINGEYSILIAEYTATASGIITFKDVKEVIKSAYTTIKTFEEWMESNEPGKLVDAQLLKDLILTYKNVSVSVSAWEQDNTYNDYGYRAKAVCLGIDADYVPYVTMNAEQIMEGIFAPLAQSGKDFIYIYAMEIPAEDIVIPTIQCIRKVG